MSDSKCVNAEFVSHQLNQSLSLLLKRTMDGFYYEEDCSFDFFGNNSIEDYGDWKSVWSEVVEEDIEVGECVNRWAGGLQCGEPISLYLLVKAIERLDVAHDVQIDKLASRESGSIYRLNEKIKELESELKKEKAKKTEPKKKASKAKKGAK